MDLHWLSSFYFNYVWPSIKGNGPEAAAQTLVYAGAAVALIPPVRKFLKGVAKEAHAEYEAEKDKIETEIKAEVKRLEHDFASPFRTLAALLRTLSHVRLSIQHTQPEVAAAVESVEKKLPELFITVSPAPATEALAHDPTGAVRTLLPGEPTTMPQPPAGEAG